MHKMFIEKFPRLNVKYEFYFKYFNKNFSLRFGRPQVDTCIKCEELTVSSKRSSLGNNTKRAALGELMIHKRRAKKFYYKFKEVTAIGKEREDVAGITFDLMQNLPLPHISVRDVFYFRQLWVYCFGIHDLKSDTSKMYMHHEGETKKGTDEVCSMLMKDNCECVPPAVKTLYLFSDGCSGQNKNNAIIWFCLALTD